MASIRKYKTATGTAWRVQYRSPDGRNRTKQGFAKKAEAEAWAAANTTSITTGAWIDPSAGKITVAELGTQWLAMQTHLKPSVRRVTDITWKTHVEPTWGNRQISTIKPSEVQAWVSNINRSPTTVRQAHAILAKILDMAYRDRLIPANPARGVTLPKKRPGVKVYLTAHQLARLAANAGEWGDMVLLLGTTGLRWGEAVALRPRDFDMLRKRIHITRNAVTVGQEVIVGTPKTNENRVVAVTEEVLAALRPRFDATAHDGVLFSRDGQFMRTLGHGSWFDYAVKRCQEEDPEFPRITPHGLRHVAAGLMVSSGANVKVVQRQLGHASAAMTLDRYADLFDEDLDGAAVALNGVLKNVVGLSWDRENRRVK